MNISWLAGFFDGEGWICFHGGRGTHGTLSPAVGVGQAGERGKRVIMEISNALKSLGVDSNVNLRKQKPPNQDFWHLRAGGRESSMKLLSLLIPHLKVKKVEAQDMLRFQTMYPSLKPFAPRAYR